MLFRLYSTEAHGVARSILRQEADSWDMVQDVFEALLTNKTNLTEGNPKAYVLTATANRCRTRRTRSARHERAHDELQTVWTCLADGVSYFEARAMLRRVERSSRGSPLHLALLYFGMGMTQDEIARELQLSRRTVVERMKSVNQAELASALRFAGSRYADDVETGPSPR